MSSLSIELSAVSHVAARYRATLRFAVDTLSPFHWSPTNVQCLVYSPKKVTHNILVYRQVQIIVSATCVLYISYVIEYKE